MKKEELINKFDPELREYWVFLRALYQSDAEAADKLYDMNLIAYWERDILKGE